MKNDIIPSTLISRRNFLKQCSYVSAATVIVPLPLASATSTRGKNPDQRQYVIDYLNMDSTEVNRQDQLKGMRMQEIEPVVLAEPGATPYDHKHLGWPVATMVDDTIIVAFQTWAGSEWQSGGEIPYKGPIVVHSVDGGRSWSQPIYLHEIIGIEERGGMIALGTTRSGKVILADRHGVFISEDKGKTWVHYHSEGLRGGLGPRIVEHPEYGLILPAHRSGEVCFFVSQNEGVTWNETALPVSDSFAPAEPTVFAWDKKFALLVRNHAGPSTGSFSYFRTWCYFAQFVPTNIDSAERFEELSFDRGLSNIPSGRRMDTNDVIYNPFTKRIEAVTTKRNEGFPYRDIGYLTLNLWSIDPEKFSQGRTDWRFECVLLRSNGMKSRSYNPEFPPRDGMHPAGSVVDEKRGVQHIFIYSGDRAHLGPDSGKTGIFRISRTLDTAKLKEKIRELDNFDKIFQVNEGFDTLDDWTLSGRPLILWVDHDHTDRDIVRRLREPLPEGLVTVDEQGLYIKTGHPGYYGLHNENTIVIHNYKLEFRAKIEHHAMEGDSLGVNINYGAQKQHLILRKDGLYDLERPDKHRRIKAMDMDNDWHVWKVEMNDGTAEIYMDGLHVASTPAMTDDRLGRNDAPINMYVRTTDASDPAEVRMEFFKLKNHEK